MAVKKKSNVISQQARKELTELAADRTRSIRPPAVVRLNSENLPRPAAEAAGQPAAPPPPGYTELLEDLENRIRQTQVRAATAASRELIRLYWDIGREIVQRREREGWGRR